MTTPSGERWRALMKEPAGFLPERLESEAAERASWKEKMAVMGEYRVDDHALPVQRILEKVLAAVAPVQTILEIGSGWGNYTLQLASLCARLTCVDISPELLDYVIAAGEQRGFSNIEGIASSFENLVSSVHDVVFAYNTFYRMVDIEACLLKINATATKLCIIGAHEMTLEPCGPVLAEEYGMQVYYSRLDYKLMRAILAELGIDATLIEIPNTRTFHFENLDEFADIMQSHILGPCDRRVVKEVALRFYHCENDAFIYRRPFKSGLLLWEPKVL